MDDKKILLATIAAVGFATLALMTFSFVSAANREIGAGVAEYEKSAKLSKAIEKLRLSGQGLAVGNEALFSSGLVHAPEDGARAGARIRSAWGGPVAVVDNKDVKKSYSMEYGMATYRECVAFGKAAVKGLDYDALSINQVEIFDKAGAVAGQEALDRNIEDACKRGREEAAKDNSMLVTKS